MPEAQVENKMVEWKLFKVRKGHAVSEGKTNLQELNDYTKGIQSKISETSEKVNLPLFDYYPVNRAVRDIPLRIRGKHSFDLLTAYDDVLTSDTDFRTFFKWFREREDLENENMRFITGKPILDPQLEAVRSALTKFLPEFSNLSIRRNPLREIVGKVPEKHQN